MQDPVVRDLLERVQALTDYAQSAERIRSLMVLSQFILEQMDALLELDHDLLPEVQTAAEHLTDATAALVRAHEFAATRVTVRLDAE